MKQLKLSHLVGGFDQIVSSLTNFGAVALAASVAGSGFDIFAAVTSAQLGVLLVVRGAAAQPFAIAIGEGRVHSLRDTAGGGVVAAVTALVLSVALALPVLVLGGDEWRGPVLLAAVSTPALAVQDFFRFACIAFGRPGRALLSDASWGVLMSVGFAIIRSSGSASPSVAILAWAGSGSVCALHFAPWLRLANGWQQLRSFQAQARQLMIDNGLIVSYSFAVPPLLALFAEAGAAGDLRLAQTAFGPSSVLISALCVQLLPVVSRRAVHDVHRAEQLTLRAATLLACATALLGITIALWDAFPTAVFGERWSGARGVFTILVPWAVFNAVSAVLLTAMRALRGAGMILRVRVLTAPVQTALVVVGMVAGAAAGAAVGLSVGAGIGFGLWLRALRQQVALVARAPDGETVHPPLPGGAAKSEVS